MKYLICFALVLSCLADAVSFAAAASGVATVLLFAELISAAQMVSQAARERCMQQCIPVAELERLQQELDASKNETKEARKRTQLIERSTESYLTQASRLQQELDASKNETKEARKRTQLIERSTESYLTQAYAKTDKLQARLDRNEKTYLDNISFAADMKARADALDRENEVVHAENQELHGSVECLTDELDSI
jgi:DNA repair exonuclease SbcCD ATPase subunit